MYTNTSTPTRTLPQQALDVLTSIEEELGRSILLIGTRPVGSRRRARILIPDAWHNVDGRLPEPVPQETKDNAIVVVIGATESGGQFTYKERFTRGDFVENTDFNVVGRYFTPGEYVMVNDEAPEAYSLEGWRNYADLHENLACFGFGYSTNWDRDMVAALDWGKIIGDPVRIVGAADFAEEMAASRRARDEQAFAAYMMSNRSTALTQARARLTSAEQYITQYTDELARQMTVARTTGLEITGIEARLAGQEDEGAWRQKWGAIVNHAKATEVRLVDGLMTITTQDLFMTHPRNGETRWLGRFDITINPNSGTVRLTNLDNPKGGRDHPHVPQSSPCWGNAASMVSTLMSQGELYALLDLCIMFLETFNLADDWGAYAAYWFDVDDETPSRLRPTADGEQPVVVADGNEPTTGNETILPADGLNVNDMELVMS